MFVLTATPVIALAENSTPFDSYEQVHRNIFVYDKSLFSKYTGSDVSQSERRVQDEDVFFDRERIGIFDISPSERVYVDQVDDHMTRHFEIRNIKNGKLIGSFDFYAGAAPNSKQALLFSGQGAIYEYSHAGSLCWGMVTRKYVLVSGKLKEVPQPYMYIDHGETELLRDVKLFLNPNASSSQVASLTEGTSVIVLSFKSVEGKGRSDNWLLIKTPLGLTGWIPESQEVNDYRPSAAITVCN